MNWSVRAVGLRRGLLLELFDGEYRATKDARCA
jgi:hypothetical protein